MNIDATPSGAAAAGAIAETLATHDAPQGFAPPYPADAAPVGPEPVAPGRQPAIPAGASIRVVGDVHGDVNGFRYATATDRFIVQLGDLMDHGPDSAATMRMMFDLVEAGRGLFVLGNHELKLARMLSGEQVRSDAALHATVEQMDDALKARALRLIAQAPVWVVHGKALFVHGGFHTSMLDLPAPSGIGRPQGPVARALYGEPTGRMQADGYPERSLRWVDRIPPGLTVYCGHDCRSQDGRPYRRHGAQGGLAVFLDTGAGKGGHLSWIDLP